MSEPTTTKLVLPVVPIPGVVFPGAVATIALETDAMRHAIAAATAADGRVLLLPEVEGRTPTVGVIARVPQSGELPNGVAAAIVQAEQRAKVLEDAPTERAGRWVAVEPLTDARPTPRIEAAARELRVVLEEIATLRRSRRLPEILRTVTAPGALADSATAWAETSADHQLTVLEATEVGARVDVVLTWAKEFLAEAKINEAIRQDVTDGMDKQQREFLLRRQLDAIRKELGEGDDDAVAEYRRRVADAPLPDAVRAAVHKEIDRLERAGNQSPEHAWIRTWLDRVLELPWGVTTDDNYDLTAARAVLDADHYGLTDVKDRIIEFLAVRKLRSERGFGTAAGAENSEATASSRRGVAFITTLAGPPGVGKTSLGESVARAMGRKFTRVALGGIRDEAEIRGHRRTYVGSQPGRIVRALTEAGSMNPVMLLDEVDKLSPGGWSGDPTAALLEVLDPAQNHTFRDHYMEIEIDLSDVVFIATANMLDTVPAALLDRMEIVRLDGYTEDEKVFIAQRHLLPRQFEQNGLREGEVIVEDATIRRTITEYTREAGVRGLERELGKLLRKTVTKVVETATEGGSITITADDVPRLLGRPKFEDEVADRVTVPGVATGLAVTGTGGDVLFIEATATTGEHESLTLTGQLGDVMKESAQIALSYVRSHAESLGVRPESLNRAFHVHVPAGAVPKDGPSAGITLTTAFVSLLADQPVKPTIGMTGEITLQGKVLPIGGVKQKVLAAHRAGLTEVIIPKRNGRDLEDVPESVRSAMTFHLADTYADVLAAAFEH
jgi:ATP-dependent Lon protease